MVGLERKKVDKKVALLILLMGGSLKGMNTPSGEYFSEWDAVPTHIEPNDMAQAIRHGLWLAQKYDAAELKIADLERRLAQRTRRKTKKPFSKVRHVEKLHE